MSAPREISDLVDRFAEHAEAYRSGAYNETQLRREFVDPMFKALGWDMDNLSGYAEAYKDVIHEDAIKIGGATKAPDYCFRIGGTRKFFLEAKKPSVDIKSDAHPAFQLRRYAWSAKLPLSILTDFEEFAVYDCRVEPALTDKAGVARVLYLDFTEYASRWDDISRVFSREAILKGSFDKFAESNKAKRGTMEVDDAFLYEIEKWRADLARNLASRNPKLSQRDLNFSVQRTIDRIVFLRICEDRRIEVYGRLQALQNGPHTYDRMRQLFREADERYNSGLFHFQKEKNRVEPPDDLTPGLEIDDDTLKKILKRLYYPHSPYEFSVLPADILGQVYEQFLGKVIRLTENHQAKVEDKPEVKKAGGVYYTPTYIVEYIVKNTVGKLLENKNPKQAAKLRVLDPACGSGSFLIGAYQYLLDWHRDWFVNHDPKKHATGRAPVLYQASGGEWKLTTTERKRILLQNIFGVDIDAQAVETTKLSLLLKVLEGESEQSLATQLRFFHERALPDLGSNIKCGNSLIASDFYEQQQILLLDEEERYRINVFDWLGEFPDIIKRGGFDAVIGNPPYVRMEGFKALKDYLRSRYVSHEERADLYAYFIERANKLLSPNGRFGMIVSNKFLRANYGAPLRGFLTANHLVERITDFAGLPIFKGATVRTVVLFTSRDRLRKSALYSRPLPIETFRAVQGLRLGVNEAVADTSFSVADKDLGEAAWNFAERPIQDLLTKIRQGNQILKDYSRGSIFMGVKSGLTDAFVIDAKTRAKIIHRNRAAGEILKPFLNGRDVRRYSVEPPNQYLIYTFHGVDIAKYPAIEDHLRPFKEALRKRATDQEWYELQQPQLRFSRFMEAPKIIFPDIATSPRFAFDDGGHYGSNTTYFIARNDLYLLGLLNSKLSYFYFVQTCAGLEGTGETYLRFFGQYLEGFPVRTIDVGNPTDKKRYDQAVELVERMMPLHKQLAAAKTEHASTNIQRQIDATDGQIDRLVYELYDLTDDEIKIVEEGAAR